MRKRTIRNGMRLVLVALIIIIVASFYHTTVADILGLTLDAEMRLYRLGIFWSAAVGGYGVVLAAFGMVFSGNKRDSGVRILPVFLLIAAFVFLFFYLLATSFTAPANSPRERLRPGETITI
jgi:glucan phosphoethanolaminetransferase (alkaline phosphatase superfamily)